MVVGVVFKSSLSTQMQPRCQDRYPEREVARLIERLEVELDLLVVFLASRLLRALDNEYSCARTKPITRDRSH